MPKPPNRPIRKRFDQAYYDRFYRNAATRSSTPQASKKQAMFIAAYLDHLGLDVHSILDMGCGVGTLLRAFGRRYPRAALHGVEYSEYACSRYGWDRGSVVDYAGDAADLVICNDVVPYLDETAAARSISNLAKLTNSVLFFGALTREDWANCDEARTDAAQHLRSVRWYRNRLDRHFLGIGGGLYLKKPPDIVVWRLDRT